MEQKDSIEIEHVIANSKIIEKVDIRVGKIEDKLNAQELLITKWLNYFFGMSALVVTCCAVLGWAINRGIDNNDRLNDIQTQKIDVQIQRVMKLENENTQLREDIVSLKHYIPAKSTSVIMQ